VSWERKRGRGVQMETRGSGIGKERGNGGKGRVYKQHITPLTPENKIITHVTRRYERWQVSTGFYGRGFYYVIYNGLWLFRMPLLFYPKRYFDRVFLGNTVIVINFPLLSPLSHFLI
jgi:hypothetical protein